MARHTRSRPRAAGGETGKLVLAIAISLVTLVAVLLGAYFWATAERKPKPDPVTLCPPGPPKDMLVMLMDTTDGLPEASRVEAMKLLTDLVEATVEGTLLEVRVIDPALSEKGGRVILTVCNPGDGKDISEFNGNPEMAKRIWRNKFREPMIKALQGSMQQQQSATSPILKTLQGIALQRFTSKAEEAANKHLVIISDMLEHTSNGYSHYSGDLRYQRFKTHPYYKQVSTNLKGAGVDIFYIDRDRRNFDTRTHAIFWKDWAVDNGGQFRTIRRLQGAGKS